MASQVNTEYEIHQPWIYLNLVAGRIETLQYRSIPDDDHDDFVTALMSAISSALNQHTAERWAELTRSWEQPADPYRDEVMAFVQHQLLAAQDAIALPDRGSFPQQADGRDASGAVHASVIGDTVTILDIPVTMLRDAQRSSWAIRDAINLALERLRGDVVDYVNTRQGENPTAPEPIDWQAMAAQARRLS